MRIPPQSNLLTAQLRRDLTSGILPVPWGSYTCLKQWVQVVRFLTLTTMEIWTSSLLMAKTGKDRESDTTAELYRNLGDGTFANVTRAAKLDIPMYGMGLAIADYDNDGDADIFFANLGKNRLFRNNGNGTFTDVTEMIKVGSKRWSTSAAFFDYNRDGWLDLFVCNYVRWTQKTDVPCIVDDQYIFYCTPTAYPGESCRLYRNRGGGTFEDVTVQAGSTIQRASRLAWHC